MSDLTDIMEERDLWRRVVVQAVQDATGKVGAALTAQEQRAAQDWFRDSGKDFRAVCEMAGLDPVHVRNAMLATIGDAPERLPVVRRFEDGDAPKPQAAVKAGRETRQPRVTYTAHGQTLTMQEWSQQLGLTESALFRRLRIGLDLDEVFSADHIPKRKLKHFIEHDGERLSIDELSSRIGISKGTIWYRINNGWNDDEIATTPLMKTGGRVATSADQLRTGAVPTAQDCL